MPCWGLRTAGVGGGRPQGGCPPTFASGVWCQALSLPRPPALWGGRPGFRDPCVTGAVGVGVRTQHRPHSVRPCEPSLCAVEVAEGRPRRGAFRRCEGRLSSGARPPPAARPLGGLSGSATHVLWARLCGCGGPALSPWLACAVGGCVPRGWRGAVPRQDGLPLMRGGSGFWRCPSSCCPPSGRAAGVRCPHAVGAGVGVCGVCGACAVFVCSRLRCSAVRAVVRGAVLRLLLCAPLSGALLWCCACRVHAVTLSPRASLTRLLATLLFFSLLRRSFPFPLLPVGPPASLACTFPLPPPWCLSLSFSLPTSLVPLLRSTSFCPAGSCETEEGCGCGLSGSCTVRYAGNGTRCHLLQAFGGEHGSEHLFGYLCSLSFPFVCRGVACNILALVLARGRSWW